MTNQVGSGEFLLVKQGTEDVKMVVRTINSSAFTQADWDEYVVTVRSPFLHHDKSLTGLGTIQLQH